MDPKDFVIKVKESIINENLNIYKNLFETTDINAVTDQYWKNALVFFSTLNESQKDIFYQILRQVEVDTVSNIFAILDGISFLEGQEKSFKLEYDAKKINGDLQDIFFGVRGELKLPPASASIFLLVPSRVSKYSKKYVETTTLPSWFLYF